MNCRYIITADHWIEMRLASIAALFGFSGEGKDARRQLKIFPSLNQTRRLTLMLKILDCVHPVRGHPATTREVASEIVFPRSDLGRAIEWKSSSQRRQTQRLVSEARHIAATGYRSLLKGKMVNAKLCVGQVSPNDN